MLVRPRLSRKHGPRLKTRCYRLLAEDKLGRRALSTWQTSVSQRGEVLFCWESMANVLGGILSIPEIPKQIFAFAECRRGLTVLDFGGDLSL